MSKFIHHFARNWKRISRSLTDYRWALYYSQRVTYRPSVRQWIANRIARYLPQFDSAVEDDETDNVCTELRNQGLVMLGGLVTAKQISDMIGYLLSKPCFDPRDPSKPGFYDPSNAHTSCFHAYYSPEDLAYVPHLWSIVNSPRVVRPIAKLMGCKPTITNISCWWLLSSYDEKSADAKYFRENVTRLHRDVDDWVQIKLFIYLTDVDAGSAPHYFLKTSHSGEVGPSTRNFSLATATSQHGDKLNIITGEAGTAFLENTFGFHMGAWPDRKNRLILVVSYTTFPQPYGTPDKPIQLPDPSLEFDPYVNRIWLKK